MVDRLFKRGVSGIVSQLESEKSPTEALYLLRDPDGYWSWYPEEVASANKDWPLAGKGQNINTGEGDPGKAFRVILDPNYYSPDDTGEIERLKEQGIQVVFSDDVRNESILQGSLPKV